MKAKRRSPKRKKSSKPVKRRRARPFTEDAEDWMIGQPSGKGDKKA